MEWMVNWTSKSLRDLNSTLAFATQLLSIGSDPFLLESPKHNKQRTDNGRRQANSRRMMELATWMYDEEMKMYDVCHVYKCMMYIKRSVYKWAPRIETWDWGCHRAVEFYQNLPRGRRRRRNLYILQRTSWNVISLKMQYTGCSMSTAHNMCCVNSPGWDCIWGDCQLACLPAE